VQRRKRGEPWLREKKKLKNNLARKRQMFTLFCFFELQGDNKQLSTSYSQTNKQTKLPNRIVIKPKLP